MLNYSGFSYSRIMMEAAVATTVTVICVCFKITNTRPLLLLIKHCQNTEGMNDR